jgi:hypothetical protein
MPDVFSEDYAEILNRRMDQEKDRSAGDPWCIGYFIDNELLWGPRPRASKIVDGIMAASANAAAKKAFAADLMAKYKDIGELNAAWSTSFESWAAFMEPIKIEKPNEAYTERRNELDMRIGKVLRFSKTRTVVSIDLYNALNTNAMIVQNQAYASYLRPVEILNARLIKFSWAFDF